MSKKILFIDFTKLIFCIIFMMISFYSCQDVDNTLAPYAGSPRVSGLTLEERSFTPKITWIGGYVTAIGINKGTRAALDSTLIWLMYKENDGIRYPVQYGQLQNGAQDLTTQFGGIKISELIEDSVYTIWVIKQNVWNSLSALPNKTIVADSSISEMFVVVNDTIKVSNSVHTQVTKNLDNYINVYDVAAFGRLGSIKIEKPTTSNNPLISWTIVQSGVTDTLLAAIGIAEGNQYSSASSIWEVYSEITENGVTFYGKHNVIPGPLPSGQIVNNTKVFVNYPADGLERNKTYYIWIANKDWDGVNRLRATPNYAFATFKTR